MSRPLDFRVDRFRVDTPEKKVSGSGRSSSSMSSNLVLHRKLQYRGYTNGEKVHLLDATDDSKSSAKCALLERKYIRVQGNTRRNSSVAVSISR